MAEHSIENILLIDDESSVLFALKLLLGALGYSVSDFTDPEAALCSLKDNPSIQLILCDLRMPKMTGLHVLEQATAQFPHVPFILMSAHAVSDEVQKAYRLGAKGFLAKPFTPDQLKETLSKIQTRD